jgi:flagellar basal body-associated protein FliL
MNKNFILKVMIISFLIVFALAIALIFFVWKM